MSEPFVYIATWRIKGGKFKEYQQFYHRLVAVVAANEPQLIAFVNFVNEERTEMTMVQVHPDAASMDTHMKVLGEFLGDAFQAVASFLEVKSMAYYGPTPESFMVSIAGRDLPLDVKPHFVTALPANGGS